MHQSSMNGCECGTQFLEPFLVCFMYASIISECMRDASGAPPTYYLTSLLAVMLTLSHSGMIETERTRSVYGEMKWPNDSLAPFFVCLGLSNIMLGIMGHETQEWDGLHLSITVIVES
jgi:hypothetical protein